ncbi:MAG: T9SS type A sorting domain-containing protein, partial [Candidatus Cloacimonadota bacterium]|nr:T9SS type A sorting domain-containing protein [Candidatus Cloacimonadota bacterium]
MKNLTIYVLLIIIPVLLFCDNSMEAIAYIEGENEFDKLGMNMTSLDFNGDGFDELVIWAPQWPEGTSETGFGKLYFYEGGPDFDAEYDFGLEGTEESKVLYRFDNLGDMNGDGYEDLGVNRGLNGYWYIDIYFGNDQQELEPDVQFLPEGDYVTYKVRPLGDVNADGFDDAGVITASTLDQDIPSKFCICYGSDTQIVKEVITEEGIGYIDSMSGVGDVNNDGYDDFTIGYAYYDEYEEERFTNTLYYGREEIDSEPDVVLWDEPETFMTLGKAAGRFNGDEYDDFVGHFGTNTSTYIWYGQENITNQYDLLLPYGGGGGTSLDYGFDYGDVNNDGYDDLAIGYHYAGGNGKAYLYLGGEDPNNVVDLEFTESVNIIQDLFGYSLTMGYFDGDEYADLAVGAPTNVGVHPHNGRGYVFVYGGNGQIYDTANEEEAIPQPPKATLTAHPNPFNPTVTFQIKANNYDNLQINIFNVKGQKVKTIKTSEIIETSNHQVTWNAQKQASGVYYCSLVNVATGQ